MAVLIQGKNRGRIPTELGVTADWFVGIGLGLLVIGGFAVTSLLAATIATTLYVGILMVIGSSLHIAHAFRLQDRNHRLFWLVVGLLYAVSGALAYYDPLLNVNRLTLLLAGMLIVVGVFRIGAGIAARGTRGATLIAAGGVLTLVIGTVIAIDWPVDGPWIFGLFLSLDMVFQGCALVAIGIALTVAETKDAGSRA